MGTGRMGCPSCRHFVAQGSTPVLFPGARVVPSLCACKEAAQAASREIDSMKQRNLSGIKELLACEVCEKFVYVAR